MSAKTSVDWSQFCDGLPLAGHRDLDPAERSIVEHRARRLLIQAAATLILMWGAAAGIGLVAIFVHPSPFDGPLSVVANVAVVLLLVAVGVLVCNDLGKVGCALRRDAKRSTVARYASTPSSGLKRELEILPISHLNWTATGHYASRWHKAPKFHAPSLPDYNPFTDTWVVPLVCYSAQITPASRSQRRQIAVTELRELRSDELSALRRVVRVYAARATAWIALMIAWLAIVAGNGPSWDDLPDLLPLVIFILLVQSSRSTSHSHQRDIKAGKVVVTRWPSSDSAEALSPPLEYLPYSTAIWSLDGEPAQWRRQPWWQVQSPIATSIFDASWR